MLFADTEQDRILSLLAYQPRHIVNGMIRIPDPPHISNSWRTSTSSSIGHLDAIPLELLHMIFAMLDLRTLSDLSRTCLRGVVVVNSLPEFRNLMEHAPQALAALARTHLIRHFSTATVHAALTSANCISCNIYGAFLFLPTCERCCYHCLWKNQSFWMVPMSMAKQCFGFSRGAAKQLLVMQSVPGRYHVKHTISRQRSLKLVSVGAAKKLALAEKRTQENMTQDLERLRSAGLPDKEYHLLRFLQQAPTTPPGIALFAQPTRANVPNDMFCGMASILFPFLTPDHDIEQGFWCLGCERTYRQWSPNSPCPEHLSHLVLPGCCVDTAVHNVTEVARSKSDFLDHVNECPGAKEMFKP